MGIQIGNVAGILGWLGHGQEDDAEPQGAEHTEYRQRELSCPNPLANHCFLRQVVEAYKKALSNSTANMDKRSRACLVELGAGFLLVEPRMGKIDASVVGEGVAVYA